MESDGAVTGENAERWIGELLLWECLFSARPVVENSTRVTYDISEGTGMDDLITAQNSRLKKERESKRLAFLILS